MENPFQSLHKPFNTPGPHSDAFEVDFGRAASARVLNCQLMQYILLSVTLFDVAKIKIVSGYVTETHHFAS